MLYHFMKRLKSTLIRLFKLNVWYDIGSYSYESAISKVKSYLNNDEAVAKLVL